MHYIKWFEELTKEDIDIAGGKGANLGQLTNNDIKVPPGFVVKAAAYEEFINTNELNYEIKTLLKNINIEDSELLNKVSKEIRNKIEITKINDKIYSEIEKAYQELCEKSGENIYVAVRSSATAEDLPEASFAGQQDTYLYIHGIEELANYVRKCWSSLWTARAIYYREQQGFNHFNVLLSAVVQKMVNSEKSGVVFTVNPINNNRNEIMINSSWGLGEAVVSGIVTPDEYIYNKNSKKIIEKNISKKNKMIIKKPLEKIGTEMVNVAEHLGEEKVKTSSLCAEELELLINMVINIEELYGEPQDIEWAYDQDTEELYILQSRPITTLKEGKEEMSKEKKDLKTLIRGLSASPGIARGKIKIINDIDELARIKEGDILVTAMTNPDMVPAMRRAEAVVTDEGGRTCHAAIVSRELGIPCIVGVGDATKELNEGDNVTVDATRGVVYQGFVLEEKEGSNTPSEKTDVIHNCTTITATKIYMNLGEPQLIGRYKNLSFDGIGLMRTEFIFNNMIGVHPIYLLKHGEGDLFIQKLSEGITQVAQEIYPRKLVVRLSDFRTNEFRNLKGGDEVEPVENNPMIGWRGVSRYISPEYEEGFRLECKALKKVKDEYSLNNVYAMLPFVRTVWEVEKVLNIMAEEGLERNKDFKIWLMAEVPAVIFMAQEFSKLIDGFSIGSNDLTQLIMGADRDSGILNRMGYFDERNPAIKRAIEELISVAHENDRTVSICGQGPSIYPEFAEFLVNRGIDSISVNPDTVEYTRKMVASVEQKLILNKLKGV